MLSWPLAVALGITHAFSFAPSAHWWLQLLSLSGLTLMLLRPARTLRAIAGLTWLFSLASFVTGLAWMTISMHRYGGMPAPMAGAALVLLAAYLSVFSALAVAGAAHLLRRGGGSLTQHPGHTALVVAACWTLSELARGQLFTGFPWLSPGYAHVDGPLVGFAPLVGVYGVGFGAVLCAVALATALTNCIITDSHGPRFHWQPRQLGPITVLVLATLAAGWLLQSKQWSHASGAPLTVRLLQGNVPQNLKFNPVHARRAMVDYVEQVAAGDAQWYLLPETAWTVSLSHTPAVLLDRLFTHLSKNDALLSVGVPMQSTQQQRQTSARVNIANSVATFDKTRELINRYDKRHLVPFGEFIPTGFSWFVDMMQIPLGEFGRGSARQPLLSAGEQQIGFNICYEDLFGEELITQVRQGATILANVSNLGWFGDSHALPQHLNLSRFRSIELGRPMLRSTNTGVTALIDHRGQVLDRMPNFKLGALDVSVQGTRGRTPFSRIGLWGASLMSLLVLAGVLVLRQRRRRH